MAVSIGNRRRHCVFMLRISPRRTINGSFYGVSQEKLHWPHDQAVDNSSLIETFVDHKRAEASFRSALLSLNKLHSPVTHISPLSNIDQEEPGVRGREATTPDPSVMLSFRGKSCQQHRTHAQSETWKTYLGYFLCGIMGRISKSSLDSGRSSCVKRSERREEEERGGV